MTHINNQPGFEQQPNELFIPTTRIEHQIGMCYPMYTEVGIIQFGEAYATPVAHKVELDMNITDSTLIAQPDRMVLPLVMRSLVKTLIPRRNDGEAAFDKEYGISQRDVDYANQFETFGQGFNDPDFPWHFSAGVASAIVDQMVSEGKYTAERRRDMTLTDWADIISSGWFSELMHSMAFTANGVYGQFGNDYTDYLPTSLIDLMIRKKVISSDNPGPLFDISTEPVEAFETTYPAGASVYTATATHNLKVGLRAKIDNKTYSGGCPVARHRAPLPVEQLTHDPHTRHLIEMGRMVVEEDRTPGDGEVPVSMENTAIDDALMVFAAKLREYDEHFGTPVIKLEKEKLDRDYWSRWPRAQVADHQHRRPALGGLLAPVADSKNTALRLAILRLRRPAKTEV